MVDNLQSQSCAKFAKKTNGLPAEAFKFTTDERIALIDAMKMTAPEIIKKAMQSPYAPLIVTVAMIGAQRYALINGWTTPENFEQ